MNSLRGPGQPTQQCRRSFYETGRGQVLQNTKIGAQLINPQYALEAVAPVSGIATFVTRIDVAITALEGVPSALWLLAWDVSANADGLAELANDRLGAARSSYGPIPVDAVNGASIFIEPQELFAFFDQHGRKVDEFLAEPYDNGVILALSETPTTYTAITSQCAHYFVRKRDA